MKINKIKTGVLRVLPLALALVVSSCDPTIDFLAFELPEADSIEDETAPSAFFGSSVASVAPSDTWFKANFGNGSVSANTYFWDFGDGKTSTEFEPEHSYEAVDGTYTVTLTVSDAKGLSDTYSEVVNIVDNGITPAIELFEVYNLVNTGESNDPVTVHSFSSFEVAKGNEPLNSLDKEVGTLWVASDGATGDGLDDGEYAIYDLGSTIEMKALQFKTNSKANAYGYQILYSTTGTEESDFIILEPSDSSDNIALSIPSFTDWQLFIYATPISARYVKLIGYGRYRVLDDGTYDQTSEWTSFDEIEFYTE